MNPDFQAVIAMYFHDNPQVQQIRIVHSASTPGFPIVEHKYNSADRRPLDLTAQQSLLKHAAAALVNLPSLAHGDALKVWRDGDGFLFQFERAPRVGALAEYAAFRNLPF